MLAYCIFREYRAVRVVSPPPAINDVMSKHQFTHRIPLQLLVYLEKCEKVREDIRDTPPQDITTTPSQPILLRVITHPPSLPILPGNPKDNPNPLATQFFSLPTPSSLPSLSRSLVTPFFRYSKTIINRYKATLRKHRKTPLHIATSHSILDSPPITPSLHSLPTSPSVLRYPSPIVRAPACYIEQLKIPSTTSNKVIRMISPEACPLGECVAF